MPLKCLLKMAKMVNFMHCTPTLKTSSKKAFLQTLRTPLPGPWLPLSTFYLTNVREACSLLGQWGVSCFFGFYFCCCCCCQFLAPIFPSRFYNCSKSNMGQGIFTLCQFNNLAVSKSQHHFLMKKYAKVFSMIEHVLPEQAIEKGKSVLLKVGVKTDNARLFLESTDYDLKSLETRSALHLELFFHKGTMHLPK